MNDWEETLLPPEAAILDAIGVLSRAAQIVLVVTEDRHLLGTITDGDIRRAILRGLPLDTPVAEIAHRRPLSATERTPRIRMLEIMETHELRQLPILSANGTVVGLTLFTELVGHHHGRDNAVVLMAGGLGTRLRPLTENMPKPLLPVGGRPIMEILLESLAEQGFCNFFISVNYKAKMIRDHFGDGERWGVSIDYLEESERLGTAGPLRLFPTRPTLPILVINGDLMTGVNASSMLDFHESHKAWATMGVRNYDFQIPFGVVKTDQERITTITEKPTHRFLVNGGAYCLSPATLDHLPPAGPCDMTDLFDGLVRDGREVVAFPIHEHWLDVGRFEDLEKARSLATDMEGA